MGGTLIGRAARQRRRGQRTGSGQGPHGRARHSAQLCVAQVLCDWGKLAGLGHASQGTQMSQNLGLKFNFETAPLCYHLPLLHTDICHAGECVSYRTQDTWTYWDTHLTASFTVPLPRKGTTGQQKACLEAAAPDCLLNESCREAGGEEPHCAWHTLSLFHCREDPADAAWSAAAGACFGHLPFRWDIAPSRMSSGEPLSPDPRLRTHHEPGRGCRPPGAPRW